MPARAMIVVGGGSSSRFGGEKLLEIVAGVPMVAHTVNAVLPLVDKCVLVGRADLVDELRKMELGVEVVMGGDSRTLSEMAGLAAVGDGFDLIGIHDAARPLLEPTLVRSLYRAAEETGGAVPVIPSHSVLIDRRHLTPIDNAVTVQTPQVFAADELMAAYVRSAETGEDADDTVEIIHRFSDIEVVGVPGDPANIKVTFPEDLDFVRARLEDPSRI